MTDIKRPHRYLNPGAYKAPLPVHEPLISQREMVRRIASIRAVEGFDSRVTPWATLGPTIYRIGRAQDVRRAS